MTTAELIKKLQELPPNTVVLISEEYGSCVEIQDDHFEYIAECEQVYLS